MPAASFLAALLPRLEYGHGSGKGFFAEGVFADLPSVAGACAPLQPPRSGGKLLWQPWAHGPLPLK